MDNSTTRINPTCAAAPVYTPRFLRNGTGACMSLETQQTIPLMSGKPLAIHFLWLRSRNTLTGEPESMLSPAHTLYVQYEQHNERYGVMFVPRMPNGQSGIVDGDGEVHWAECDC